MSTFPSSFGVAGLDRLLDGLYAGDNVVWRVDRLEDYRVFCRAIVAATRSAGLPVVYMRFASHAPIFEEGEVERCTIGGDAGFEHFITAAHARIQALGPTGLLIFDSLSDLSGRYYSDRMIGNFFQLTCPLVKQIGSIAFFTFERHYHSHHTVEPISATTQILIDLYRYRDEYYVQTLKADARPEAVTFALYRVACAADVMAGAGVAAGPAAGANLAAAELEPITSSDAIARVINSRPWPGLRSASYRMIGVWDRLFLEAEHLQREIEEGLVPESAAQAKVRQLLGLIVSREERVVRLAHRYLSLADLIGIWKRMIGTGYIGGKSIGMLLARAILRSDASDVAASLEEHDSFFVGSDVYYTFLVINHCWWERQRQKDPETFLEGNEAVRERILHGEFPRYILERFEDMLDYYGRSPIIVRSSSLLEDNFGNAFAGKYESVFCTNQGTRAQRLEAFLDAVRRIYASTISDEALRYRKHRGILDQDEQMALLVQRVSGSPHGAYFFPHLAGVAFSFNPYVWQQSIDPAAGMIRLVFGLGTRAVDRADDDYTRVVALNAPEKRPEGSFAEVKRRAQRRVDVLDFASRSLSNVYFVDLLRAAPPGPLDLVATVDRDLVRDRRVARDQAYVLTFERLLKDGEFVPCMRRLLEVVREAYETHVDIEFTANVEPNGELRINVVQCRPLQVQGVNVTPRPLPQLRTEQIVMHAHGGVVGHSRMVRVRRIVYVRPEAYAELVESKRYELGSVIRAVTHPAAHSEAHPAAHPSSQPAAHRAASIVEAPDAGHSGGLAGGDSGLMLIGPGRWGTSTPALGVPVRFSDIDTVDVLCEIDTMHAGLVADLSLGTHFFNELVELNLLYLAYFGGRAENRLDQDFFEQHPNRLAELSPAHADWSHVVHVINLPGEGLILHANHIAQEAVLYRP